MVGKGGVAVVLAKIARNGLAIVGSKQLGGSVPELARVRGLLGIELVFKFAEARREERVEFELVADLGEVERSARSENDDLFRKVAIVWVIKTVCVKAISVNFLLCWVRALRKVRGTQRTLNEVPHQHPDSTWTLFVAPQFLRCDHWIFLQLFRLFLREDIGSLLPPALLFRLADGASSRVIPRP